MPVIIEPFSVTSEVAAKVKAAMEQRVKRTLTDTEAKAELRAMARSLITNDIRSHLRDAHNARLPDSSDVILSDF